MGNIQEFVWQIKLTSNKLTKTEVKVVNKQYIYILLPGVVAFL